MISLKIKKIEKNTVKNDAAKYRQVVILDVNQP
jgi:hypothetical protein